MWYPRARLGIHLSHSPSHADSVVLVFNLQTGLVSPQYHVVIDDDYSMVPSLRVGTVPSNWKELVDNTRESQQMGSMYDIMKTRFEADSPVPHAPPSAGLDAPDSQDAGPEIVGTVAAAGDADDDNVSSIPVHNPNMVTQDDTLDEPTTQDINECVNFEEGSQMPPVLNLQTAGLRRSPRIAKLKRPWYKCNLIAKCSCALTAAATFQWTPILSGVTGVYASSENMIFSGSTHTIRPTIYLMIL